ncbi:hypothetical protein Patl1_23485 [Pistacia atlantica]|uniref:Uncharacterized protein n=1 Tax=Pistacia atlantica TaxID=434234 RepID=A0ACC0ZZV0_9ROSI|nr:hypothetical protein Patl1_23485 [Pistacia atlantica]
MMHVTNLATTRELAGKEMDLGITCCSKHRRVTALDLNSRGLFGSLTPYIGNLSFLRDIELYNNNIQEYGIGSKVSTNGDVCSYGILVLETITGKRLTNLMFEGGLNLHNFARMALPDQVMDIVDPMLLNDDEGVYYEP